jgi:hypothetical protein
MKNHKKKKKIVSEHNNAVKLLLFQLPNRQSRPHILQSHSQ